MEKSGGFPAAFITQDFESDAEADAAEPGGRLT